jgi:hypothetical protein
VSSTGRPSTPTGPRLPPGPPGRGFSTRLCKPLATWQRGAARRAWPSAQAHVGDESCEAWVMKPAVGVI